MARLKRYTLTRTNGQKRHVRTGLTVRELGQEVFWCATDNLGMFRRAATTHGVDAERSLATGRAYELGPYTYTAEPEPEPE